ncbi:DUF1947 domain-containing protein [Candidatus Micrarchaeota archaeon]|nr:DUF1947 domain-containing protein [Candidatus Micrarchaeota archaeon]
MCRVLRGSEIKRYINQIEHRYGSCLFSKKDNVELCENKKGTKFLKVNGTAKFILADDIIIPTLNAIINDNFTLPKVVVDMGTIPYLTKGADVMRPGIVKWDSFNKNDYVLITDENHDKPLAIGYAMFDSKEFNTIDKGKVIKTIHYVGDDIWQLTPTK